MDNRNDLARFAVMTGLALIAFIACFPPRDSENGLRASRGFLFSKNINYEMRTSVVLVDRPGWVTPGRRPGETETRHFRTKRLNVATGRMLRECLLVLSLTGICAVIISVRGGGARWLKQTASVLAKEAAAPPPANRNPHCGGEDQLPPNTSSDPDAPRE